MRSIYKDNIKFESFEDILEEHQEMLPAPGQIVYRRIAGSKRVARYQNERGSSGQLLQSITAQPALSTRSFEVSVSS